jgi:hypothetical protein
VFRFLIGDSTSYSEFLYQEVSRKKGKGCTVTNFDVRASSWMNRSCGRSGGKHYGKSFTAFPYLLNTRALAGGYFMIRPDKGDEG